MNALQLGAPNNITPNATKVLKLSYTRFYRVSNPFYRKWKNQAALIKNANKAHQFLIRILERRTHCHNFMEDMLKGTA